MSIEDRTDLDAFVFELRMLLSSIIEEQQAAEMSNWPRLSEAISFAKQDSRSTNYQLIPPNLAENLRRAWQDVQTRLDREEDLFGLSGDGISEVLDASLEQAGLSGSELRLKLLGFQDRSSVPTFDEAEEDWILFVDAYRWRRILGPSSGLWPWPRSARELFLRRLRSWLVKTLGWANIILGSLVGLLPVLEPLKEIKEVVEHLMSDDGLGFI